MRLFFTIICFLLIGAHSSTAQRKVNKMNGLSEAKATKKKYNKQWIKMRSQGLPSFSAQVGVCAGPTQVNHNVSEITEFGRTMLIAPELVFNINPTKNLGFNFGLSYRNFTYTYMVQNTSFTNDTLTAIVNGDWRQKFGNIGISLGFTYYGNVSKSVLSCSGFGIIKSSATYFYWENGVIIAPSLFNEVYLRGSFNEFNNGEPGRSGEYPSEYTIMYNTTPRKEQMLLFQSKMGLRFHSGEGFATRIGPFFNFQLNSNGGLVNDYTAERSAIMAFGVNLGFEFY